MNTILRVCTCIVTMCGAPTDRALAQVSIERPALVKNIATSPVGQEFMPVGELNGMLIFLAFTAGSGWELWRSDGSEWSAVRINDINPGPTSALHNPYNSSFTALGGALFFAADDGVTGVELWKTDGTESGTVQVKDARPGPEGSSPKGLLEVNGVLFFTADGEHGAELWRSDGTTAGTVRVKVLPNYYVSALTIISETILFTISTGDQNGLWKSDGTDAGTLLLRAIPDRLIDSSSLINANGTLFFTARDPLNYSLFSLWKSDGTAVGTVQMGDFSVQPFGGGWPYFTVNSAVFFGSSGRLWMSDGTIAGTVSLPPSSAGEKIQIGTTAFFTVFGPSGPELWKSDGTLAGTQRLHGFPLNANGYSGPYNLVNANGTLLFTAGDETNGVELWRSDSTPAGTAMVKDIVPGAESSSPSACVDLNGVLLFTGQNPDGGVSLWKTDGTGLGTALVKLIHAGTEGWTAFGYGLGALQDKAVFLAAGTSNQVELWATDGTETGTIPILEFPPTLGVGGAFGLTNMNGLAYFMVWGPDRSLALWRTDGTSTGTFPVRDAYPPRDDGSYPGSLVNCDGQLFFSAREEIHGQELWKSDGTETGTLLVKDITPGADGSDLWNFVDVNGVLFFTRRIRPPDLAAPRVDELWKSDGTEAGTTRVKTLDSAVQEMVNLNGTLFFQLVSSELWISDGTEPGTQLVTRFMPVSQQPLADFVVAGDSLFFTAYNPGAGRELWKTDGTESGTAQVKDIARGMPGSLPHSFVELSGRLLFFVDRPDIRRELWRSDGSAGGTVQVKTWPDLWYLDPHSRAAVNGTLFFTASESSTGGELWKSDGTESGTVRVKDINPGPPSSDPYWLTGVGGTLFFWASTSVGRFDLWKSDGTESGTVVVKESVPGPWFDSSGPAPVAADGILYYLVLDYFGWFDPANHSDVWRTDGTEEGTYMINNRGGERLSLGCYGPYYRMVQVNGTVFFSADNGISGCELWKVADRDSDGDGLPDWWESRFFPENARPEDDPDGDGLNNWEESRAGTDPTDPGSVLKLSQIRVLASGTIQLEWPSVPTQVYTLLRSSSLSPDARNYTVVEGRIPATPPVNSYVDATAKGAGPYFYLLKIEE